MAALGGWWWPAAVIGVLTVAVGYRLARGAAAALADLIEAAVDIELPALAGAMGVVLPHQRVTADEGLQINNILNKGA